MFRLRTTVSLSVLALAVGVAGTAWLSGLTGDWQGPAARPSPRRDAVRTVLRRHARSVAPVQPPSAVARSHEPSTEAPPAEALPALVPIDTPSLPASWLQRTAFADGRVVLRLRVDAAGHVSQADVSESSGSAELDQRALRTASRWRFAVPSDQRDGLTGSLVMRFDNDAP